MFPAPGGPNKSGVMTDDLRLRTDALALFLDFDGTLVALADHPSRVQPPPGLGDRLIALHRALGGALAVISGRALPQLEPHLPPGIALAGSHGGEWRHPAGPVQRLAGLPLDAARLALSEPPLPDGVWVEDKGLSLALHYRARPDLAGLCGDRAARAAAAAGARAMAGKQVFEIKPPGIDKGAALRRFMDLPPFHGRQPVFVGDDVTDEDGIAAAMELGGFGIKVGLGESRARYRLDNVNEVHAWLDRLLLPPPT